MFNELRSYTGIAALPVGFTKKTTFTFKLVYGEQLAETVNGIELSRYVIQVQFYIQFIFFER